MSGRLGLAASATKKHHKKLALGGKKQKGVTDFFPICIYN
jgi:hypothetical protein